MFTVKILLCELARKQYLLGGGCMSLFFFEGEGEGAREGGGGSVPVKFV